MRLLVTLIRSLVTLIIAASFVGLLVALAYAIWARLRGVKFGTRLGAISERLHETELTQCIPSEQPDAQLLSKEARILADESGSSEDLRRANLWAGALEEFLRHNASVIPRGTVMTTYGFVKLDRRIQLSVIQYVRPIDAFRQTRQPPIQVGDRSFPVVVRPWVAAQHSTPGEWGIGNCYVAFNNDSEPRLGVLTADHSVKPEDAQPGSDVTVSVNREPKSGVLRYRSKAMDAAVVEIGALPPKTQTVRNARVVGYKPVRLVTPRGSVEADVVEITGFVGATILGEPGREPGVAVKAVLNRALNHGDSGCLGLDLEFAQQPGDPLPYLMYLGEMNLGHGGSSGYALLLCARQPRYLRRRLAGEVARADGPYLLPLRVPRRPVSRARYGGSTPWGDQ